MAPSLFLRTEKQEADQHGRPPRNDRRDACRRQRRFYVTTRSKLIAIAEKSDGGEKPDLWKLAVCGPDIDPNDLARAVEDLAETSDLDYRSRLLIRDSVDALRDYWTSPHWRVGWTKVGRRRRFKPFAKRNSIKSAFDPSGNASWIRLEPESIRQYFEQLGQSLPKKLHIDIAGAVSLILPGYVERSTSDIDVVGEVPSEIRTQYKLLDDLEKLHGLHLGHVQTHYFPRGWSGAFMLSVFFGALEVSLVDVYDVFLSKLFARTKDLGDLKVLAPQLDKAVLVERFLATCPDFLAAAGLKELATNNWRIIFAKLAIGRAREAYDIAAF